MVMLKEIRVKKAAQHNLKHIDIRLPRIANLEKRPAVELRIVVVVVVVQEKLDHPVSLAGDQVLVSVRVPINYAGVDTQSPAPGDGQVGAVGLGIEVRRK